MIIVRDVRVTITVDGVTHCESLIRRVTADTIKIILRKGVTDVWKFVSLVLLVSQTIVSTSSPGSSRFSIWRLSGEDPGT